MMPREASDPTNLVSGRFSALPQPLPSSYEVPAGTANDNYITDLDFVSGDDTGIQPSSQEFQMPTEGELRAAEIAAAEARGDTKITRLEGKIETAVATLLGETRAIRDELGKSRSEANENKRAILITIVGSAFALAALLLTVMSYGDSVFSRGMSARDLIQTTIKDYEQQRQRTPSPPPSNN